MRGGAGAQQVRERERECVRSESSSGTRGGRFWKEREKKADPAPPFPPRTRARVPAVCWEEGRPLRVRPGFSLHGVFILHDAFFFSNKDMIFVDSSVWGCVPALSRAAVTKTPGSGVSSVRACGGRMAVRQVISLRDICAAGVDLDGDDSIIAYRALPLLKAYVGARGVVIGLHNTDLSQLPGVARAKCDFGAAGMMTAFGRNCRRCGIAIAEHQRDRDWAFREVFDYDCAW